MTTPTNSALHMMEGQGGDIEIARYDEVDYGGMKLKPKGEWVRYEDMQEVLARRTKTALSHFADEVEASGEAEKQTQIALLAECRSHLPLAAASWNDDEDRTVASFHVTRILDLIKRVDAALSKVQQ